MAALQELVDTIGFATIEDATKWRDSHLPTEVHPIQRDWREEIVYFLLPDRFSDDGASAARYGSRPKDSTPTHGWNWWAISGLNRFQGGTLAGIASRLDYLQKLEVTTIWIGPVWKQRNRGLSCNAEPDGDPFPAQSPEANYDLRTRRRLFRPRDDYHGYAIQDFLRVDPRFGSNADLRRLVEVAHGKYSMRVILDIVFNHSGENWLYEQWPLNALRPPYRARAGDLDKDGNPLVPVPQLPARYPMGAYLDNLNQPMTAGQHMTRSDGVWPAELRNPMFYSRRGQGDYGAQGPLSHAHTQYRDADWYNRDFALSYTTAFDALLDIWKFWMVYSGCDGFRVDTFKHFPPRRAAQLTQTLRQFAADCLGVDDFLVLGEIGGRDADAASYLEYAEDQHLRVLGIGERRQSLRRIAGGDKDAPSADEVLEPAVADVPVELVRDRVMMTIDDHDGLGLDQACRLAARYSPNAVVGAAALLLFGPGIPCVYYGTEQALAGPVGSDANHWLDAEPNQDHPSRWGLRTREHNGDRYLREAMFGPVHPRRAGEDGIGAGADAFDDLLPGFGPNGTSGYDAFIDGSPWFRAVAKLIALRKDHNVLWSGAIHTCPLRVPGDSGFSVPAAAGVVAWTRSSDEQRALIVLNNGRLGGAAAECQIALPETFAGASALRLADAASASSAFQLPLQTVLQVGPVDSAARGVQIRDIAAFSVHVYLG